MSTSPIRRPLIVCLAALWALSWSLAFPVEATAGQWVEQFTAPFASQVINVLDGHPVAPPTATGASVRTVAGLNVGEPVTIESTDGQAYAATVLAVTPNSVTWTPAISGDPATLLNGFVRSAYSLYWPKQSALDAQGRIYTIDSFNNRVVVFDPNGRLLWTVGRYGRVYSDARLGPDWAFGDCSGEPAPACPDDPNLLLGQFFDPFGIDVSDDGTTIVVSDSFNDRIQVLTQDPNGAIAADSAALAGPRFRAHAIGGFPPLARIMTPGTAQLNGPAGIALDRSGRIVVADQNNHRIQIFTPATNTSAVTAIDTAGDVHRYDVTTVGSVGVSVPPAGGVTFNYPEDVAFDRSGTATDGRIIVADANNNRVQVLDGSGNFITAISPDGIAGSAAGQFDLPVGVTVDEYGFVYVADMYNFRIQVFRPDGAGDYQFDSAFGAEQTPDAVPGQPLFIYPSDVAVAHGRLVVTEYGGQRIRVFARAGMSIDSVAVDRTPLRVQNPPHDTVRVRVTVRNTGAFDLTGVTLSATSQYQGMFSATSPASVDLAPAGSAGDTTAFEFGYTVTGGAADGFGQTLRFRLSAAGWWNGTVVAAQPDDVDTHVTVLAPADAAIALGPVTLATATPGRATVHDRITLTVPVGNAGGRDLHDIVTTVTATSATQPSPVSPGGVSSTLQTLPTGAAQTMQFTFTADSPGFVRFVVSVTSKDTWDRVVTAADVIVPGASGIEVVASSVLPLPPLDETPPEAFNRLDPSALGGRCTTTIAAHPASYFCTNKVYGTDDQPGLTTSAFAPVKVVATNWGHNERADDDDDDDHDWDGGAAELHTYTIGDAAASAGASVSPSNQVTLVEKVRQSGNEARIRVMSYQYRRGAVLQPAIVPDRALAKYQWSTNANGSLKSLVQTFELHKGRDRAVVQASYDPKTGVTTIKHLGKDSRRVVVQGLTLLRMTTSHGELKIDYDLNAGR